jgi:hypothetical protein
MKSFNNPKLEGICIVGGEAHKTINTVILE